MPKTLKEIVQNSNDLFLVKVIKPEGENKHNPHMWKIVMDDPRWTDDSFKDYKFRTVHLKRGNSYFLAYKSDESNAYFVDPKTAMYRTSATKYVNNLVEYAVKTNDISITKDQPSFRVTKREMEGKKIDNFLDLCYHYRHYSAIGTGYTRDIRNLIVMDIDVDCTKLDNRIEINNLLNLFAKYNSLPDFYVFNKRTNHVQLQWLVKDVQYKTINTETVNNIVNQLNNDFSNKELDYRKTEFTVISKIGIMYRRYTSALTDIVDKRKFGDKAYTFWKAKNPMTALIQAYDLELKMPYLAEGEIRYLTDEEMNDLFSSKDSRREYFNEAPDLDEWFSKMKDLMEPLVKNISETKVMKMNDANDVTEIKKDKKPKKKQVVKNKESFGKSRNTYVVKCTRSMTWEIARKYGYRTSETLNHHIKHNEFNKFKNEVFETVYQMFKNEDDKYGGVWPDTSNRSTFTEGEFRKAFNSAFNYAVEKLDNFSYSDEDRQKSLESRKNSKNLKLIIVDGIRQKNTKITREELLKEANKSLKKLNVKKLSMGSLKRFIAQSNELTEDDRMKLQLNLENRKIRLESNKS